MTKGRKKKMTEKREILLALRKQYSIRGVSRKLRVHRPIVRAIYAAAAKKGWLNPASAMPEDHEIAQIDTGRVWVQSTHSLDPFADKIKEWRAEGYSAVVIQTLLRDQCKCEIGTLRRYIRKICPKLPDPVMVRNTKPGEVMDVDFGFLGTLWDESREKFRKVWIFSARLRHSRKAYRKLVWEQTVDVFLLCHILAFEHFGGVPEMVCLDNLKAGVIKSCVDNDMPNRAYKELAEHYGFMISPCLPCTPQHKGGVENDINYVQGNFWARIREKKKTHPYLTLHQAQEDLEDWDASVANIRKIHGIGRSPEEIFLSEERIQLKSLPEYRFELTRWLECIVRREWWITCEGSRYSVPYELIGKTVQVRMTSHFVKVFFEHQEVANHPKAPAKGSYQRNPNHAPPFKEKVLVCNRSGLLEMASEIGNQTRILCERMLSDRCVDKLRPTRCLLSLAEKYGKNRLEMACERALSYGEIRYASVKNILEKGLDKEPVIAQITPLPVNGFRYARNPLEYRLEESSERVSVANATKEDFCG